MLRILFLSLFIGNFSLSFAQDTLIIDDGSIWWQKSSCEVDFRCYDNIDDLIAIHCSDSVSVASIELRENVFESSSKIYTECRIQKLADYLKEEHNIEVGEIIATPVKMSADEMRQAIADQNFRTVVLVLETNHQTVSIE